MSSSRRLGLLLCEGVGVLEEVGAGNRRKDGHDPTGGPWREDEPEGKARRDPLADAEGAGDQLAERLAGTAPPHLLVELCRSGRPGEAGKRRAERARDGLLGDEPAEFVRR